MARSDRSRYNIGAVSRLSGVSREKIRIWERRYGAVQPTRDAGNHRLYSHSDVERLSLIRGLVDRGHAISSVANLSLPQLKERTAESRPARPVSADAAPSNVLVVSAAPADIESVVKESGVTSPASVRDPAAAQVWLEAESADLIIVDLPTLLAGELTALIRLRRQAPRSQVVLVYRFAPRPLLDQLRTVGFNTIKAPLQVEDLVMPSPDVGFVEPPPDPRARRYTPAQLRQIASLADRMLCECPRHLADLIRDLNAFEDYSLGCEVDSAADAALHREIYDIVTRARSLVEDAMALVAADQKDP